MEHDTISYRKNKVNTKNISIFSSFVYYKERWRIDTTHTPTN